MYKPYALIAEPAKNFTDNFCDNTTDILTYNSINLSLQLKCGGGYKITYCFKKTSAI